MTRVTSRPAAVRLGAARLAPGSVAVVGASDVAGSPGRQAVENLVRQGFPGPVWPVNRRYETVAGVPCFATLDDLPEAPDAVFVLVAAAGVPDVVEAAAARGARLAVVSSSGLGEGGDPDGGELAGRIRRISSESGMRILGPNTEGFWNVRARCFVTLGSALRLMPPVREGSVAVVSQSGSVGAALGWRLTLAGVGLSHVVMTGNELDIDALEVCDLVLDDPDTTTVALFVEGLHDAHRLKDLGAKAAGAGKHLVALKTGNTTAAKIATLTHTGKFASDAAIYADAFRRAGVLQVDRIDDLVRATAVLTVARNRPSRGVAVVAVSGGARSVLVDAAAERSVPLPDFAPETEAALREAVRSYSSTRNPCDIGGWSFSSVEEAEGLLRPILDDPATDSVLVQFASRGREESLTALRAVQRIDGDQPRKPMVLSLLTDGPSEECAELARAMGVIICTDPTRAVTALGWLYQGQAATTSPATASPVPAVHTAVAPPATVTVRWHEACSHLTDGGVPIVASMVLSSRDAITGATAGGDRFVLKLHPDDVTHKTDLGGVRVGLRGVDEVAAAWDALAATPGFCGRLLLQPEVPAAAEVLVSAFVDADFGAVLCVGAGGVDVETAPQKAYAVLPLAPGEAAAVVRDSGALASGARRGRENDATALVDLVERVGELFIRTPGLTTVELNPVLVGAPGSGAVAVDVVMERTSALRTEGVEA